MAAKGYTTKEKVAASLGLTFSAAQNAQCDALIPDVEAWVDQQTQRAWLTGAVTDELHPVKYCHDLGAFVLVKNTPIASVESVKVRSASFSATDTSLVEGTGYVVRDVALGRLELLRSYVGHTARVSYTPVATLPGDLELAVTAIVAYFLAPALQQSDMTNVESYSLPDLTVKFRPGLVPMQHRATVLSHRRVTVA